jgi:autotransporter-associated beta strand protein
MREKMLSRGPLAPISLAALTAAFWPLGALAQTTQDIRIVTYNTQGDVSSPSPTQVLPNIETVIEGIGQQKYVGDSDLQLPDVIALQETTSNSTTVTPIVTALNNYIFSNSSPGTYNYFGANTYAASTYQATTSDGVTSGGGPNALIYNQNTLSLMASVGVGTPASGTNGEFRQVVRYEFQPIADKGTGNGIFYVYDSHYKSGAASTSADGSTDGALRNGEAQIIRNDEAANLPASAAVVYVGDYNFDGTTEAMYKTLTAANAPSGVNPGQGAAIDPLNYDAATQASDNYSITYGSSTLSVLTDADTALRYRDDVQTMTYNVFSDAPGVLGYINNSYHAFGNNGTTPYAGSVNSGSNTSLNDLVGPLSASTVKAAENKSIGSDHLPVVADYSLALQAQNLTWNNVGTTLVNNGVTWDINHYLNWNSGANSTTYTEGSTVTFNDLNDGNYTVTLNTTVNPASVIVNNSLGNYSIAGTGSIAGAGSMTKSGSGNLVLSTVNTYTGGTNVTGGVLEITPTTSTTSALPAGPVNITGGTLQLDTNVTLGSQSGPIATSNVNITSLSITGNGTLDLNNNHIIINYGSGPDPIASIAALIASGYAGGSWTGTGITSTAAQNNSSSYGIGYADSADPGDPAGLASGQIEIMYTLLGDANLDGAVNGSDFSILATNFNKAVGGWDQGDFDYDGSANGSDFAALAANFNKGASQSAISAADAAAVDPFAAANGFLADVPEPATLGLLVTAGVGVLSRRRRSLAK